MKKYSQISCSAADTIMQNFCNVLCSSHFRTTKSHFAPKEVIKPQFSETKAASINIGCGISKMVGPKKQDFWPKINILKGNHFILRIRGAPVRQKLSMLLENKVI